MNDLAELKVRIDGHVAILTMDSPPVNALSRVLNDELTLALDRIGDNDEIRVAVLTGAGRVFCAGADLKGRRRTSAARAIWQPTRAARANAFTPCVNAPNP